MGFGAFGGIMLLVGLMFAFIGHKHMGEGSSENYRGAPVYPIEPFILGLVLMGAGVIVMIVSFVNGTDGASLSYGDFFSGSSGSGVSE